MEKDVFLQVRMSAAMRDTTQRLAKKRSLSVSEYIRKMVTKDARDKGMRIQKTPKQEIASEHDSASGEG